MNWLTGFFGVIVGLWLLSEIVIDVLDEIKDLRKR